MEGNIDNIKKIADQIEWSILVGNKIKLKEYIDDMMNTCKEIKAKIENTSTQEKEVKVENINQIPFLYKPILKKNFYEGNYLEEFSEKRTNELNAAQAFADHNKFWQTHEIIKGNIFGSLPAELISKEAKRKLEYFGWEDVKVNVLEIIKYDGDMKSLTAYCEGKYNYFVIVKEKLTGAEMILHYDI
ncbi:hypothetical protein IZY60_03400 [Lutibacter sp. B2]|nr:hypothetical protein [Lutibacter sp. B2]